jgi:hypothetical protein
MKSILGRGALAVSAIAVIGLAGYAYAQPAPPPPTANDAAAGEHHHHHDPAQMRQHMADHLRAVLQLQPSQDGALNAFLDSMKPPEGAREHHDHDGDLANGASLTTPERLDKMAARMDEHRARFNQMAAATKQFYAQLSPTQQKAFDSLPMGHEHGDRGGEGGHWGHGEGRGGPPHGPGDEGMGPDGQHG